MEVIPRQGSSQAINHLSAPNIVSGGWSLGKVIRLCLAVRRGVGCVLEAPVTVLFKGKTAGDYFADILVTGKVLVELKDRPLVAR